MINSSRLRRGVAVLLLALAAVDLTLIDLAFPQFCNDEQMRLTSLITPAELAIVTAGTSNTHDSKSDQHAPPAASDEDCFCCCAHILPSYASNEVMLETQPRINNLTLSALPTPPLQATYRPPRSRLT